jgi:hypothetical protein
MKHIKLFEEVYVRKKDFPFEGNDLSVKRW